MPNLRDLLKKKDKIAADESNTSVVQERQDAQAQASSLAVPEFKIVRTTTEVEEEVQAPDFPENDAPASITSPKKSRKSGESKRHTLGFRRSSHSTQVKEVPAQGQDEKSLPIRPKDDRRLSARLHLHRSPSAESSTSQHLPGDLPEAPDAVAAKQPAPKGAEKGGSNTNRDEEDHLNEHREAQWEKRATLLAQKNPLLDRDGGLPAPSQDQARSRSKTRSPSVSSQRGDDDIQEAIRLHEIGELSLSTAMFGRLGDPKGANNALAQVLYGLALRHGWGVEVDSAKAIQYLSLAASNSAGIEKAALESGTMKGGAAKGELVLAIFELGNCFRHGWGVKKDAAAARQYYETAANLGDTDAMEEAAWCFVEGFGGGKDKFKAAQYLRLAEEKGHKTVGNSWIWKDKYNPK